MVLSWKSRGAHTGVNEPLLQHQAGHSAAGAMVPSTQRSERVRAWHRWAGRDRIRQRTNQWEGNTSSVYSLLL